MIGSITAICTVGRTDTVDSILQMRILRVREGLTCLSHLSFLPHRVAVEPSVKVLSGQTNTLQKYHRGCLRWAQKWDHSVDW